MRIFKGVRPANGQQGADLTRRLQGVRARRATERGSQPLAGRQAWANEGTPERCNRHDWRVFMEYDEKLQDRADNKCESKQRDEDAAFEMRRQRDLDNAAAFYEVAVMKERLERRAA